MLGLFSMGLDGPALVRREVAHETLWREEVVCRSGDEIVQLYGSATVLVYHAVVVRG